MLDKGTLLELEQAKTTLNVLLPKLSKHKVRELKSLILHHYEKTYNTKGKPALYGTLNKGFEPKELEAFLAGIESLKFRTMFKLQSALALRVGEVIKIRLQDIRLDTREIKIHTEKAKTLDTLIIPLELFGELTQYIEANKERIERAEGYIFYADKETSHTKRREPWLELNYVRKVFRQYVRLSGLDETYAVSEEKNGRSQRHLHRLTTHSLRHYGITKFYRATKDPILTSRYARHLKPETTLTYIHSDRRELYEAIEMVSK